MKEVLILITTESNYERAKNLAKMLIEKKLAACVSIKNIDSIFKWEGDIEEITELEITIKTKPELKKELISFLKKMTTYNIPQILYQKFHAKKEYYDWLIQTT